jgi:hypothetical protein
MKLPTVQLAPFSRYFTPVRSKYSPQHPVLKHPQSMLFPQRHRPSFTTKQLAPDYTLQIQGTGLINFITNKKRITFHVFPVLLKLRSTANAGQSPLCHVWRCTSQDCATPVLETSQEIYKPEVNISKNHKLPTNILVHTTPLQENNLCWNFNTDDTINLHLS